MADIKDAFKYRLNEIQINSFAGQSTRIPTRADKLEEEAKKHLSKEVFAYVAGGAGKERALDFSRNAFSKWAIRPRVLTHNENVDTSIKMLGQDYLTPLMLCPIAYQVGAHKNGELETARAALNEHTPMILSMQSGFPLEEVSKVLDTTPKWMQLYWSTQPEFNKSIVKRAEAAGYGALVLTLDTKMVGWRSRDMEVDSSILLDTRFYTQYSSDPVLRRLLPDMQIPDSPFKVKINASTIGKGIKLAWDYPGDFFTNLITGRSRDEVQKMVSIFSNKGLSWDDVDEIKKMTKLPLILKGILHPEDAKLAVKHKVDGIVVSTHGGRQLSSCIGSLDALPDIANEVKGKIPIIFDSGIQGGADMFKAIALGADAVGLGRAYYYALGIAGAVGVRELIRNLNAEFYMTMLLAGCSRVEDIKPECLVRV